MFCRKMFLILLQHIIYLKVIIILQHKLVFRYLRTTFSLKNTFFFSQDLRFVKSMATGVQSKWEVIHNMKLTGVDHNHCKYKYTTQWKNSTILKKFCYYHIHKKETLKMMFKKIYIIISCTYTVIKLKKN